MEDECLLSHGLLLLSDCEENSQSRAPLLCCDSSSTIGLTQHGCSMASLLWADRRSHVVPHTCKATEHATWQMGRFCFIAWSWRVPLSSRAVEHLRGSGGERALCPVQHTDSALYLRPFTVFLCSFSFIAPVCWESSTTSTTETRLEMPALSPFLQQASEVLSSFGKLASRLTNSLSPIPFL